jgi:tRNA/rRNA methyltransferase
MKLKSKSRKVAREWKISKDNLPVIILARTQMPENIGMTARAMLNCGLYELRLVKPVKKFPNQKAFNAGSGADVVLNNIQVFKTVEDAIADLHTVYATCPRDHGVVQEVVTAEEGAKDIHKLIKRGRRVGILFGPERAGLTNDDVVLCNKIINIPLNPGFSSLNIAQAVLLVGYAWHRAGTKPLGRQLRMGKGVPARKEEVLNFFNRLERELDKTGFLYPPEKAPTMVLNIRAMFQRADLLEHEVNTLHGIISALNGTKKRTG